MAIFPYFIVKCPYVGGWVVLKSLKTPLRNIKMAPYNKISYWLLFYTVQLAEQTSYVFETLVCFSIIQHHHSNIVFKLFWTSNCIFWVWHTSTSAENIFRNLEIDAQGGTFSLFVWFQSTINIKTVGRLFKIRKMMPYTLLQMLIRSFIHFIPLTLSFPPSGTFYSINRQNCVNICKTVYF